jgi:hypothetical protein
MTPGCGVCFGDDAGETWARSAALRRVVALVEESHFSVRVVTCGACGQAFASVFCETIDWRGGNDPQEWLLLPLTSHEAAVLTAAENVEGALAALAPERYLVRSFPSDAEAPAASWRRGRVWVPRHD